VRIQSSLEILDKKNNDRKDIMIRVIKQQWM